MIKIDNTLLQEVGLGNLPDAEKNAFLKHIYETLEMNVGVRLADQMSNEQLDEFEKYFEAKDDAGAFKWLETNFPNYKEIVQEEFDKLKAQVAQQAPQILAASQAQPVQAASTPAPQQQASPYAQQPAPQPHYPPQQQAPAPAQPYADPTAAPQQPQPSTPPQPPAPSPTEPQNQPSYQPPFPQQQPPAGPQFPPQQ
jgi:hypothetical protein